MATRELILNFHGLADEPPAQASEAERNVWVSPRWFEQIVETLPREGVQITFDDGNASDAQCALGMLSERGLRARFFVLTERVGAPGHLDERQLLQLHEAGMTVGSHGLAHRDWRGLDDAQLRAELVDSKRMLEDVLGAPVREAACPFGSYDRRVLRALRTAGYARVYNSDGGTSATGAWLAQRNTVHRGLELERWLELAAAGAQPRPSAKMLLKRTVKRLR